MGPASQLSIDRQPTRRVPDTDYHSSLPRPLARVMQPGSHTYGMGVMLRSLESELEWFAHEFVM